MTPREIAEALVWRWRSADPREMPAGFLVQLVEDVVAAERAAADARVSAAVETETQRCVALCYAEADDADRRIAAEPMASERFADYWRRQKTCANKLAKRLRTAAPAAGGSK